MYLFLREWTNDLEFFFCVKEEKLKHYKKYNYLSFIYFSVFFFWSAKQYSFCEIIHCRSKFKKQQEELW